MTTVPTTKVRKKWVFNLGKKGKGMPCRESKLDLPLKVMLWKEEHTSWEVKIKGWEMEHTQEA